MKMGQGISSLNHVLPPEYHVLQQLQDEAPYNPYEDVEKIFIQDFGMKPDEIFEEFEKIPIASASIAQVHRAKLKGGGPWVAVKVQKPHIKPQMPFDLGCYRIIVYLFEKIFDMPMYWTVDNVIDSISKESDFRIEAKNMERARKSITDMKRTDAYVPTVVWDKTGERILTQEWITGVKISNVKALKEMGFSIKDVMTTTCEVFAEQVFHAGFVHCDPHPGNLLIRGHPENPKKHQVVIIDHGLYISEREEFRQQYCRLWKAMILMDTEELKNICIEWGVRDPELFASMQLMKPYSTSTSKPVHMQTTTKAEVIAMQLKAKERVKKLLGDTSKTPRELILVGRHLNLVRSLNKQLGSPVNRVEILADCAASAASKFKGSNDHYFNYRLRLLMISLYFHYSNLYRSVSSLFGNKDVGGYEENLEKQFGSTVQSQLGFKINLDSSQSLG